MLKYLLIVNGIFGFIVGSAFVWFPALPLDAFGIETNTPGTILAQVLGAAFLAYGVATAAMYGEDEHPFAQKLIIVARLLSETLGTLILLLNVFRGNGSTVVWIGLVLYLLFTVGYFVFGAPLVRAKG